MKVTIIGNNGQLGSTLMETIPEGTVCSGHDLPEFDITDPQVVESVVSEEKPDVVINASAYTAVDLAEKEVDRAFGVNAAGPGNLAVCAKKFGCRFIHVSTDYVFDGTACSPYRPDATCHPLGVYGQSKRQGEVNIISTCEDFLIVRTSWLYSRFGANFVLTMLNLMRTKDELGVVADQAGSPTSASTLGSAIWAAVGKRQLHGIYHWADAGIASWYDFAVAIQEEALARDLLNRTIPIRPIGTIDYPTPAKRPAYSVLDSSVSWRDLSVAPRHWRLALRQVLDSIRQA
jgi:dTDP-4-dehydrorhamnose reductase